MEPTEDGIILAFLSANAGTPSFSREIPMKTKFEESKTARFGAIMAGALMLCTASAATAGVIYDVNLDGSTIDLTGFIETNALGNFSPSAFDGQVIDFSITASENLAFSFLFNLSNSTWGLFGNGALINILVTDERSS